MVSNGSVLDALRHVQLRKVPWYKRSTLFDYLRSLGLIESTRSDYEVSGVRYPLVIALLTKAGQEEIRRLASLEQVADWESIRLEHYNHPHVH